MKRYFWLLAMLLLAGLSLLANRAFAEEHPHKWDRHHRIEHRHHPARPPAAHREHRRRREAERRAVRRHREYHAQDWHATRKGA